MFSASACPIPDLPSWRRRAIHTAALALLTTAPVWAQPAAPAGDGYTAQVSAATRSYDIAPGPLSPALSRFAGQSGVTLSADPALTDGLQTPGLRGSYGLLDGFAQLLQGTGLAVGKAGETAFVLRRLSPAQAASAAAAARTLAEVQVTARADRSGATEGTESYVARSSTVGSKTGQSLREVPQTVSVVTRQQIEDMGLMTLTDALKAMPGVTSYQFAMLDDGSISRGFEMGSANVRVDGGAAIESGYGMDNDMAFYDRVEVLRGADGLFGGNGEPGGVTNLVRKKPTRERQIIVQGQYGSNQFKRGDLDVSGPLNEAGSLRGRAVLAHEDKNFFFDVADSRRTMAYGVLEADITRDTTVTLGASTIQRDSSYQGYGMPRASTGEDLRLPRTTYLSGANDRANKDLHAVFGQLAHRFNGDWRLDVALNLERTTQERYDHYFRGAPDLVTGAGTASAGTNVQSERARNSSLDASLKGRFDLLGRQHDVVLGADWSRFRADSDVMRQVPFVAYQIPDIYRFNPYDYPQSSDPIAKTFGLSTPVQQAGVYGSVRLHVTDPLRISVGGRLSRYHYRSSFAMFDPDGRQTSSSLTAYRDNSVFTPYLAATYDLDRTWTAYASVAETFKSQAGNTAGPAPGTPLDPVTGRNYELGLKGEHLGGRLHSAFAIYRIDRDGAAVRDTRYPLSSGALGSSCCYVNSGQVVSKGFDAELTGQLLPNLQVAASYNYNYNDNRDKNSTTGGRFNGLNPEHLFKVYAAYRLPGAFGRWKVGGGATAQSKTYVQDSARVRNADGTVGSQTTPFRVTQAGHTIASASVEYQVNDRWTAALNINNLFDKTYYSTIGSVVYGSFYGAPRNAMLTLRGKF